MRGGASHGRAAAIGALLCSLLLHGAAPGAAQTVSGEADALLWLEDENAAIGLGLDLGGLDLDGPDLDVTIMHSIAEQATDPALVAFLAAAGADLGARDANGLTPLHVAAARNPRPLVAIALVGLGADVAARDATGRTPLHFATRPQMALALIDAGADPCATDGAGRKALSLDVVNAAAALEMERGGDLSAAYFACFGH